MIGQHGCRTRPTASPPAGPAASTCSTCRLELGKNIVDDALHLAIRIDTDKIPGALSACLHPDRDRCPRPVESQRHRHQGPAPRSQGSRHSSAQSRSRRRPVPPAQPLSRSSGTAQQDPLCRQHEHDGPRPAASPVPRDVRPDPRADHRGAGRGLAGAARTDAASGSLDDSRQTHPAFAWSDSQADSLDYLGNEFLVWIWHTLQNDGDTVELADGSEVTVMLAKTLTLDCPRGETGRDHLTDDAPTRLPEAFRALQAGKLPRKAGMILVRQGAQYELTLQAETLAVSGASLPKPEEDGLSPHEIADRPPRKPPPPGRDARPAVRRLPVSTNLDRLDRRARTHPPVAPGRLSERRATRLDATDTQVSSVSYAPRTTTRTSSQDSQTNPE